MTTTLSQISNVRPRADTTATRLGPTPTVELPVSPSEAVRQTVQAVQESELRRVAQADAGPGFEPRTLLAIMTYCYAKDIYGSADVEDLLRRDPQFRKLCQNEFPDARLLRRFRRVNREVLQRCLERVLRLAAIPISTPDDEPSCVLDRISNEASRRLTKAIFIDSMEDWN